MTKGGLSAESFDELHEFVRLQVAAGYASLAEIVDGAVATVSDATADPAELEAVARIVAERAEALHLAEQRSWPEFTDCDRLDAAFAALEASGIVARQHFSCCATCGMHDIREELARAEKAGHAARGFTFFHVQDTEHAIAGDGLFLSYGVADRSVPRALAIGTEVVDSLRRHGLSPTWNGKHVNRIGLPLTWQRRRGTRATAAREATSVGNVHDEARGLV